LKELLINTVKKRRIIWQRHALQRMLERDISRSDVKKVLLDGDVIEE